MGVGVLLAILFFVADRLFKRVEINWWIVLSVLLAIGLLFSYLVNK